MESKNQTNKNHFHCDFCKWDGLAVVTSDLYLCCPDCGYPICSTRHNMDYLVPQAQARYRHYPYDESIGKNVFMEVI